MNFSEDADSLSHAGGTVAPRYFCERSGLCLIEGCLHASPRLAPLVGGDSCPGWLKQRIRSVFSELDTQAVNAAPIYRRALGWTKELQPEDSERLRVAASIAIDDPKIDALLAHARPGLNALRDAAVIRRCDWGVEPISADHVGKGRLDVFCIQLVRVACLSARVHAALKSFRAALDDVFAGDAAH